MLGLAFSTIRNLRRRNFRVANPVL